MSNTSSNGTRAAIASLPGAPPAWGARAQGSAIRSGPAADVADERLAAAPMPRRLPGERMAFPTPAFAAPEASDLDDAIHGLGAAFAGLQALASPLPGAQAAPATVARIQGLARDVAASTRARGAELDAMVKAGEVDERQVAGERLKLRDTAEGVRRLAALAAALPTDRHPRADALLGGLEQLAGRVGGDQIDPEQAEAEAHALATALRVPASEAPGPLKEARDQATAALSELGASKNASLERLRELDGMIAAGQIDRPRAEAEQFKLQQSYVTALALQRVIAEAPIDRDPQAATHLGRLREIGKQLAADQIDAAEVEAEVVRLAGRLAGR